MLAAAGFLMFLSGSAVAIWAELCGVFRVRRRVLPAGVFYEG